MDVEPTTSHEEPPPQQAVKEEQPSGMPDQQPQQAHNSDEHPGEQQQPSVSAASPEVLPKGGSEANPPARQAETPAQRLAQFQMLRRSAEEDTLIARHFLEDLEAQATVCGKELAKLMVTMRHKLHSMTGLSAQYMAALKLSSESLAETTNGAVEHMQDFLSKCERLHQDMLPIQELAAQIKEIRKTLDGFEQMMNKVCRLKD
ncbi:hypothetical protein QOT17_017737 [Balamuthia mandrillaris]